ncbi:MAG TPA: DUF1349 domain-containing protein, partial [Candidatus Acidoferrum sp.]|nr:DUF1349 domain-containing protein [Candidatus Acidoferrum sp.]
VVVNSAANFVITIAPTNIADVRFPEEVSASELGNEPAYNGLPDGWRESEIGTVRITGSTRCERNSFTVRGAGLNIDAESDSFHYVFQPVRGDREIIARISMIQHTAPESKAGLMMREAMSDYARNVMIAATAQRGGTFQTRHFEGRATEIVPQPEVRVGSWLKLRRRGNDFTAFKSENGRQWTLVAQTQMPMRDEYYIGLAVASAREDAASWCMFDRVREGVKLSNLDFTPQVELVSGSIISGRPAFADNDGFDFVGGLKIASVPTRRVARVIYQPMSSQLAWRSRASKPGVWVNGGDFFEGEFQQINGDKLRVASVLYGIRTFDVDEEVVAAVLATPSRTSAATEVDLQDGSRLVGASCTFAEGEIVLREAALGAVRVPVFQIRELRLR